MDKKRFVLRAGLPEDIDRETRVMKRSNPESNIKFQGAVIYQYAANYNYIFSSDSPNVCANYYDPDNGKIFMICTDDIPDKNLIDYRDVTCSQKAIIKQEKKEVQQEVKLLEKELKYLEKEVREYKTLVYENHQLRFKQTYEDLKQQIEQKSHVLDEKQSRLHFFQEQYGEKLNQGELEGQKETYTYRDKEGKVVCNNIGFTAHKALQSSREIIFHDMDIEPEQYVQISPKMLDALRILENAQVSDQFMEQAYQNIFEHSKKNPDKQRFFDIADKVFQKKCSPWEQEIFNAIYEDGIDLQEIANHMEQVKQPELAVDTVKSWLSQRYTLGLLYSGALVEGADNIDLEAENARIEDYLLGVQVPLTVCKYGTQHIKENGISPLVKERLKTSILLDEKINAIPVIHGEKEEDYVQAPYHEKQNRRMKPYKIEDNTLTVQCDYVQLDELNKSQSILKHYQEDIDIPQMTKAVQKAREQVITK